MGGEVRGSVLKGPGGEEVGCAEGERGGGGSTKRRGNRLEGVTDSREQRGGEGGRRKITQLDNFISCGLTVFV